MSPSKKEPKLASFSWASKLAAASSSAGSSAQPNLLQSLTGSISGATPVSEPTCTHRYFSIPFLPCSTDAATLLFSARWGCTRGRRQENDFARRAEACIFHC